MLGALLFMAALGAQGDPIAAAIERYRAVESYRVTLKSSHGDETEQIRYYYKKPGFVRMEFVRPHEGAVLVYNPVAGLARLWPFGSGLPSVSLSPDNRLIKSPSGQRVDRSDVGALLENVKALQVHGKTEVVGEEQMAGRATVHVTVSGGSAVANVHRYDLWLERSTLFPVKVESRDARSQLIEAVMMEDSELNPPLPDELFNP
jgi:outer membrane lipoprotein-sorting protein